MRNNKFNPVSAPLFAALFGLALSLPVAGCGDADVGSTKASLGVADAADTGGQLAADGGANAADAQAQPDVMTDDLAVADAAGFDDTAPDVAPVDTASADVAPADTAVPDATAADSAAPNEPSTQPGRGGPKVPPAC